VWHAANDNLRGTASYGTKNARITDDASFSIPYATNVWLGTEFLFMIGMVVFVWQVDLESMQFGECTGQKYLIATWNSINNGGAFYIGLDRSVTKSSASSSPCMTHSTALSLSSSSLYA
jgi:hypothetical protein